MKIKIKTEIDLGRVFGGMLLGVWILSIVYLRLHSELYVTLYLMGWLSSIVMVYGIFLVLKSDD